MMVILKLLGVYGLDNSSGTRKYQISYTVEGAIGKYSDYSQLYWQFIGEDFEIDADKITGTIILPKRVNSKEEIRVWGHTQGLNGEIYATDTNRIEFTINDFNSGVYVEVRTLFPNYVLNSDVKRVYKTSILNSALAEEKIWANEANRIRNQRIFYNVVFYIVIIIVGVFLTINTVKKIDLIKTRKRKKPSEEIIYFREVPRDDASPAEAIYLLRETRGDLMSSDIGYAFSATLLEFSLNNFIKIDVIKDENGKEETIIKLLDREGLIWTENKDERKFGEFLISAFDYENSTRITVKQLEKFIKKASKMKLLKLQEDVKLATREKLEKLNLIDKEGQEKYSKEIAMQAIKIFLISGIVIVMAIAQKLGIIAIAGCIVLIILTVINMIAGGIAASKLDGFTQEGIDEIAKWKGLKKYMKEFSLLNEREIPELAIWERFLVYATAFCIADKVLKQLKIVYPDIENAVNVNTHPQIYLMMNTDFSNSFSNAISNSMSSAYSSASGGGGGFSGGGRRWPVAGGGGGGR